MSRDRLDVFNCGLDGTSLIEASAGTGKTWNICWLYLRLILQRGLDVRQVLVVSFTKAATAELKERIRGRIIDVLACLKGSGPGDAFAAEFISALKAHGLEAKAIQDRLEEALQSFDEAAIFTIHGFCQRALASCAFSAGQSFSLEILQEDVDLITEAVHDFWRRHLAGGDISPALAAWLAHRGVEPSGLVTILKRALAKPLARTIWPDGIDMGRDIDLAPLARAREAARMCWAAERDAIVGLVMQAARDGHLKRNIYRDDSIEKGALGLDRYFEARDDLAEAASQSLLFSAGRISDGLRRQGTVPVHAFFDRLEDLVVLRERLNQELELAYLGLVRRLHDETAAVRARKSELRVQSYDDILFNLYDALTGGRYPWLAETLRQQYRAALIDEFQDTDPLQFAIFDTIYGSADCPVFFVGDPKQAIYSFRNADLNVYLKACQKTNARHTLDHNQRSTSGLIDALNALFGTHPGVFMQPGLDYIPVHPGDRPRLPFSASELSPADLQIWTLPKDASGEPVERAAAMQAAAEATADEIARLLNASEKGRIRIGENPLAAGDIAVLVRSHAQGRRIRQALNCRGIGSVELSQQSVYESLDAEELERVLGAILAPGRESLLRAALATEIMGLNAAAIAAMDDGHEVLAVRMERFVHYRETWLRRGVGVMLRELLSREGVSGRMLCRQDGERRMTNLLHLAELLHQAAATQDSPEALLRWFASRRQDDSRTDESQLRLESDRNLVQIVTIHKSKGLEYPVVFCPFLWLGGQRKLAGGQGHEYHDDEGKAVIDWRVLSKTDEDETRRRVRLEDDAETLRLIYVALTRAIYRCYLIAGCYNRKHGKNASVSESARSLLNWLVAGSGIEPEGWAASRLDAARIEQAWHDLRAKCSDGIALQPLPPSEGMEFIASAANSSEPVFPVRLPSPRPLAWRIGSFSGLMLGASSETAASEHDARFSKPASFSMPEEMPEPDDILLFPRGANAGNCIHAAFELCDFTEPCGWDAAVETALMQHPQDIGTQDMGNLRKLSVEERFARMKSMMLRMLGDVMETPLQSGIFLNRIPLERRLTELEFYIPASDIAPDALHALLQTLGYPVPRLNAASLRGYLKGFMDLVFEHEGRFYILDWKSNHLGHNSADYGERSMAAAMADHGYHLQHLLYTVALNRYLSRRMPGYDFDRHFGGVLYLFVRGVRPHWKDESGNPCGSYFHRPGRSVIERIDACLLGSMPAYAAAASSPESLTAC